MLEIIFTVAKLLLSAFLLIVLIYGVNDMLIKISICTNYTLLIESDCGSYAYDWEEKKDAWDFVQREKGW